MPSAMAVPAGEATGFVTSQAGRMDQTKNGLPKAASSHAGTLGAEQSPSHVARTSRAGLRSTTVILASPGTNRGSSAGGDKVSSPKSTHTSHSVKRTFPCQAHDPSRLAVWLAGNQVVPHTGLSDLAVCRSVPPVMEYIRGM